MTIDIAALQKQAERALQQGDANTAVRNAREILAAAPEYAPAHLLLSNIAMFGRKMRLATRDAMRAADVMHRQPAPLTAAIALRLISIGEYGRAYDEIRAVDLERPFPPSILFDFSQQLTLLEQHELALRFLDVVEKRGGETFSTAYFRGNAMKFMGHMEAAHVAFERSIALKPDYVHSHWALAFLGQSAGSAQRVERIRALIDHGSIPDRDRCYLDYALYRELELLGDDEAAWAALAQGCLAKRRTIQHDAAAESALFDQIIARFPKVPPAFATTEGAATPIFIVGMPRTGTTLLERILGNSPAIALGGELNDFRMQYKWVADYYSPGFFDAQSLARADSIDYALLGRRYLDHVKWRAPGARRFTDKNPGNFQMIGAILKALPQAKIIHLCRDPADACFSNLKELFAANAYSYSYDFGELAAHHRQYTRLMAHWHAIAPGRILDVRYEELVSDPEVQTEQVMRYLGLPFRPEQIRIEDSSQIVSTASSAQVREPIHRRNIGGWQRYEAKLQPLIDALGAR
ncbi:MAG TPA: sulfotransferase [Pseudomonadota bacterium]|nr:sulfotransferase [Xanthomonadales bacterium]HQW80746.1 sulfotransferase [Pseudomonadota bacterium]